MALPLGNEVYTDGEQVDYHFLPSYTYGKYHSLMFDKIEPRSVPNVETGTLQYKQGEKTFFSTTPAGWILKNKNGGVYNFNTDVNILNTNPFDKNKRFNIKLVKKVQRPVQAPAKVVAPVTVKTLSLGDDDYLNHQKVEYLIVTHPTLYRQLSNQWVDLRGMKDVFTIQNKGELFCYNCGSLNRGWWIIEGGKMKYDLSQFNILNHSTFKPDKPNIQLLPSGNMTERMKQVKAEKERKAAEAVKEDQEAEKNVTPIPCSQTPINLNDKVKYGDKEGIVTGFEITYKDQTTQTVRCDANLFSITAGKRNPGVVYANVVAGKRTRRKRKNRKTRYGLETRS